MHLEDVVLPGDLALRKVIQRAYGLDHLPSQAAVVAIAEAWPHRSLAVNYLFASVYGEQRCVPYSPLMCDWSQQDREQFARLLTSGSPTPSQRQR
jgi:hypothetical protein